MQLWIVLPDIHDKHPERLSRKIYHPALQCAERAIKEYKPTGIIYLGDATDMNSLCHFDMDKRKLMEGKRYRKDVDSLKHMLDRHEEMSPKSKRIYMMGNHEDWARQYIEYHPEMEGTMDFEQDIGFAERRYEVVPYNSTKKLGKAIFMHGNDTSMYHSARLSRIYPKTIFYGHVHDVQTHSFVSPIDMKEVRVAASLGCLCDLNPSWLKNRPNKWIHAFGMYWLKDNGEFQMDVKIVIKGKTIINGKEI